MKLPEHTRPVFSSKGESIERVWSRTHIRSDGCAHIAKGQNERPSPLSMLLFLRPNPLVSCLKMDVGQNGDICTPVACKLPHPFPASLVSPLPLNHHTYSSAAFSLSLNYAKACRPARAIPKPIFAGFTPLGHSQKLWIHL